MKIFISEDENQTSILYIMDLKGDVLFSELNSWSRLDLIEWLSWNDSNGVYKDEDSLREFDQIISREEALEIMVRQITEA
jgi:hypothetical protein